MRSDPSSDEDRPKLVLGLGNPGTRYRQTRHNVGFHVVAELARRWDVELGRMECRSLVGDGPGSVLALPQTYMNRSGYAARCLVELHGFRPEEVLVVYDELALPLGRLRLRPKGSPAGHRGMESVLQNLRTDRVPRLRIGIAPEDHVPEGDEVVDFVLSPFSPDEMESVDQIIPRAADACEAWLERGIDVAMNEFNG